MADVHQSILLDPPREVDLPAIERELTQLWKKAGEDTPSDGTPVVRACSLNVIIFTEGQERATGLEEIVSQVTVDHPSRIFLVSADRSTGAGIEAWVSARCSLPVPGGKQVCCEEINLTARGTDSNKIPSIITSLLVADIPTILIWKAKPDARDNVLQLLSGIADRVLIDSSEELHPAGSLVSWSEFIERHGKRTVFGDLAWTHLLQWRTLIAQAFQPAETRVHLAVIDSVVFEYWSTREPVHSGLSQSLLAAAWLAHVLQWVPIHPFRGQDNGEYAAQFRSNGQTIDIRLGHGSSHYDSPGGIASVVLHSSRGGEVRFRWMERESCVQRELSLAGVAPETTVLSLHRQIEAELVSSELEMLYHDPLYESSALLLKSLLANSR